MLIGASIAYERHTYSHTLAGFDRIVIHIMFTQLMVILYISLLRGHYNLIIELSNPSFSYVQLSVPGVLGLGIYHLFSE